MAGGDPVRALAVAIPFAVFCAGLLMPTEPVPTRLEMARRVAQHPLPEGVPPFLTQYDTVLGTSFSQGDNLRVREVYHVPYDVDATYGPVPLHRVVLGFGPIVHEHDRLLSEPLSTQHVLLDINASFGARDCSLLRKWMSESYGPQASPRGGWDGVTHALKLVNIGGPSGSCRVWWSYWPPDDRYPYAYHRPDRTIPVEAHQVTDEFRLTYGRTWFATAQRVLRGDPFDEVLQDVLDADLDEAHRAELRKRLRELVDDDQP